MGKKSVVIGAGVGGAACAALLARAGHEVTLLEAHDFPGGRCASLESEGFRYDFGVHMFSRGETGPHGEVNRRLGGPLAWVTRDPSCRVMGKLEFDFPLDIRSLGRQASLARRLGVKPRNLLGAFRLFRLLLSGQKPEHHDAVTVQALASRFTDDESVHLFLNCVSQLYFALSYREASAGELLWSFSRMFREASFGYPRGGAGEIPGTFLSALKRSGARVLYREPVRRIRIREGRVQAVETASGEVRADIVVSSAGLLRTLDLAGREHFPAEYATRADRCRFSNAYVTIKYGLDRRIVPYPVVFHMPDLPAENVFRYIEEERAPEDPFLFMPVPTEFDPGLAPEGKQLVIAGTAAPAGASNGLCEAILDRVHNRVCELFPALEGAIVWQSRSTRVDATGLTGHPAGEAIGLAQTPDQVGRKRPGLETPVRGLYLVGADAGARGIGTEMAVGSALRLTHLLSHEPAP